YISKDKPFYVSLHSNTKQMHNYSNEINNINDQGMIPNLNNNIDYQETISNSSNNINNQKIIPNSKANEDIIVNSQIKTALETFIQNYRKTSSSQCRTKWLTKVKKKGAFPVRQSLNELENADP
ncbi:7025_t:CDS:2, partial [Cetraspora pellucida]